MADQTLTNKVNALSPDDLNQFIDIMDGQGKLEGVLDQLDRESGVTPESDIRKQEQEKRSGLPRADLSNQGVITRPLPFANTGGAVTELTGSETLGSVAEFAKDTALSGVSLAGGAVGGALGIPGGIPGIIAGGSAGGAVARGVVEEGLAAVDRGVALSRAEEGMNKIANDPFLSSDEMAAEMENLTRDAPELGEGLVSGLETGAIEGALKMPLDELFFAAKGLSAPRLPAQLTSRGRKAKAAVSELQDAIVGTSKRMQTRVTRGAVNDRALGDSVEELATLDYQPLFRLGKTGSERPAEELFEQVANDLGLPGGRGITIFDKMDDLVDQKLQKVSRAKGQVTDGVVESAFDDAAKDSLDDIVAFTDLLVPDENIGVGRNIGRIINNASRIEEGQIGKTSFSEIAPSIKKVRSEIANVKAADATKQKAVLKKFDDLTEGLAQFHKSPESRSSLGGLAQDIEEQVALVNSLGSRVSLQEPLIVTKENALLREAKSKLGRMRGEKEALESGKGTFLSIRDLQSYKSARGKDAAQAFQQSTEDRSVIRQAHMSLYKVIDDQLSKRMRLVDEVAGTDLMAQLVKERKLYSTLKDFMPIANELQIAERLGKLASRKRINRSIGGAEINELTAGGAGSALATLFAGPGQLAGTVGFGTGAALAKKSLPSRMSRIRTSISNLEFQTSSKVFPGQGKVGTILRPALINNAGASVEKIVNSGVDSIGDAIFMAMAQERGLIGEDGELAEEVDPNIEQELESQVVEQLADLENALKFGDDMDAAIALSGTVKQFPEAFPAPKSGIKGEITMDGVTILPDPNDRIRYSSMVKKDPTLSTTEKAKAISTVNDTGEVTVIPKRSGKKKKTRNLFAVPQDRTRDTAKGGR